MEDTFADTSTFRDHLSDINLIDAELFGELWPDDEGPVSPDDVEHELANVNSQLILSQILGTLAHHPDTIAGLSSEWVARAQERVRAIAAGRPADASWTVPAAWV